MKRARCLIARLAVVSSSADHELKLSEPAAPGPADPGVDVTSLEAELDLTGERKGLGAYYTPPDVVDGLLRLTLGPILTELELAGSESVARVRVLDPTCGSGNFLVAVLKRIIRSLQSCGVKRTDAGQRALRCVAGIDLDARAVAACKQRLAEVAGVEGRENLERQVRVADSLVMPHEAPLTLFAQEHDLTWDQFRSDVGADEGFDLVIGNPPFLSQLHSDTAFGTRYTAQLKERFGDLATTYTDSAPLFLVVGTELLKRNGGRLCLIEPVSVLSSRGASPVRSALTDAASLTDAWFAETQVFDDAAVDVFAPMFETGLASRQTRVLLGAEMSQLGTVTLLDGDGGSWSPLLAAVRGVPDEAWETEGTLGDIATATADFRDQYYGLVGAVVDSRGRDELPKLVTAGLIDPARLLWGERPTRFNKAAFEAPRVDLDALDDNLRRWASERLVPKVLVATQTRVLEAIVDERGELIPSVPVLTVQSSPDNLWKIAALLTSPPIAAIAARRHLGSALSADALKLSAKDVVALPLPRLHEHWAVAAEFFERASRADGTNFAALLTASANEMCVAYGVDNADALVTWWEERVPKPAPIDVAK